MALEAFLQAADHSAAVEMRHFGSVTPKVISASPKRPVLSSSATTWCNDEKTWLRSTASPLRMCSHWEEGIPEGDLGAILTKNFAFEMSRLYDCSNRQVSGQGVARSNG